MRACGLRDVGQIARLERECDWARNSADCTTGWMDEIGFFSSVLVCFGPLALPCCPCVLHSVFSARCSFPLVCSQIRPGLCFSPNVLVSSFIYSVCMTPIPFTQFLAFWHGFSYSSHTPVPDADLEERVQDSEDEPLRFL
jgi:hypothetical protein